MVVAIPNKISTSRIIHIQNDCIINVKIVFMDENRDGHKYGSKKKKKL